MDRQVQLLGSGAILREVIAAAELLEKDWGIQAAVWSVTSFTELRRDGMRAERARRFGAKNRPGCNAASTARRDQWSRRATT